MPNLNTVPLGLNQLLQLQSKGDNPNELSNTVVGTIDYEKFIRNNLPQRTWGVNFTTQTATNFSWVTASYVTVPIGELWYLHSMSANVSTAPVGQVASYGVGLQEVVGGSEIILKSEMSPQQTTSVMISYNPSELLPLPAGTVIAFWNNYTNQAAVINWRFQGLYYRYLT